MDFANKKGLRPIPSRKRKSISPLPFRQDGFPCLLKNSGARAFQDLLRIQASQPYPLISAAEPLYTAGPPLPQSLYQTQTSCRPAAPLQSCLKLHHSVAYCLPQWKYGNLSPAKTAVGGPGSLLLGTIPPCLASGSASCGQTTHKKLPQMYQPQPEQKGLKTIVQTDFHKTFPSSSQTGQRMSQNSKNRKHQ